MRHAQPKRRRCLILRLIQIAAFAMLAGTVLSACGYQLVGSGNLPGNINTIAVHMLDNRTGESGMEITVTNAIIDELTRRNKDMVVDEAKADAILSGTIDALSASTVTRTSLLNAVERRLVMTASFTLKGADGELLWQQRQLKVEQDYTVGDIQAETNAERRMAIDQASQRLAEYVYERLTDSF